MPNNSQIDSMTRRENAHLLRQLSLYLNLMSDAIDEEMVNRISGTHDKEQREYAYAALLATYCGYDFSDNPAHKKIFKERFTRMIFMQDKKTFLNDSYLKGINFPDVTNKDWEFKTMSFKPYEAFLADESVLDDKGRLLPRIGFFSEEFFYPAVLQNGREWMTVTPHEIRTTLPAVNASFGNVLTYGLGLGYFPYMCLLKENVKNITVVEKDENVINLFKEYILPQFPKNNRITIICDDAFRFAEKETAKQNFDFIFADTWHDPSDGVDMYLRFKAAEKFSPHSKFMYWIENTLKYYISLDKDSIEDTAGIFYDD